MKKNVENRRKTVKNKLSYFLKVKTLMTFIILVMFINASFVAAIPGITSGESQKENELKNIDVFADITKSDNDVFRESEIMPNMDEQKKVKKVDENLFLSRFSQSNPEFNELSPGINGFQNDKILFDKDDFYKDIFPLNKNENRIRDPYLPEYVPGEFIVKLKLGDINVNINEDGIAKIGIMPIDKLNERYCVNGIEKIFKNRDASKDDPYKLSNIYKFTISEDSDVLKIIEEYKKDPNVEYAEPNHLAYISYVPNDPRINEQWAHENIQSFDAWDIEQGNADVVIAIIDTGVDYTHEDLQENIYPVMYDFVEIDIEEYENAGFILVEGEDYIEEDDDPMDFNGHGTHCAGIAAGRGDNGIGISGVCLYTSIMAVRVGFSIYHPQYGEIGILEWDDASQGIVFAADNGADVISMSFGGSVNNSLVYDAIRYAYDQDVVLVAAAGNENSFILGYPAGYDEVITVAATGQGDEKASYSNYGSGIDVAAPGGNPPTDTGILSTVPTIGTLSDPSGYRFLQGTSMACPYVAGLAGIIRSYTPFMSNKQVAEHIISTADNIDEVNPGYEGMMGSGRINVFRALIEICEHNLRVDSINTGADHHISSETPIFVNATIENTGLNNETDVIVSFFVNDLLVDTIDIPFFERFTEELVSFIYTPMDVGFFTFTVNVTASDIEECTYQDNEKNDTVIVGVLNRDTNECFETIQDAISDNDTIEGHSIIVPSGIYHENILINKGISLEGIDKFSTIIEGNGYIGTVVHVYNTSGVHIEGFTIRNETYGIHINCSPDTTICKNIISKNIEPQVHHLPYDIEGSGIYIQSSDNVIITNNVINNNTWGICIVDGSINTKMTYNVIRDNNGTQKYVFNKQDLLSNQTVKNFGGGVKIEHTNNNEVTDNKIIDNHDGIAIISGNYIVVTNNRIDNNYMGVEIQSGNNNIFTNNEIEGNYKGITIDNLSSSNSVYNNNFNNYQNAYDEGVNIWNTLYPDGGNYWSDYNGTDMFNGESQNINGSDGIGDVPYNILGGLNQDNYPFMNKFGWDWWPSFHHDLKNTGYSNSEAPDTGNILWSYQTDNWIYSSSPAVYHGKLYIGTYGNGKLFCVDATTGEYLWNYSTGGFILSSPAVADGRVFISCGGRNAPQEEYSKIICLDAENGEYIWSKIIGTIWMDVQVSSPAVSEGKVYVGSVNRNMYCFNVEDGAELWNFSAEGKIKSSPAVYDGRIYFGSWDDDPEWYWLRGHVYCLDSTSGKLIWNYTTDSGVLTAPAIYYNKVYVSSYNGNVYCLDALDGEFIWKSWGGAMYSSPAVADGRVYVGSIFSLSVYCFDADIGVELWHTDIEHNDASEFWRSSPAVADGKVYIGSTGYWVSWPNGGAFGDGVLFCLDAISGEINWMYQAGGLIQSSPAIANGCVYIGSRDEGKIYCFKDSGENNDPPYEPRYPWPPDGIENELDGALRWFGGDPNPGDNVTYDIYFGKTNPPLKAVSNYSDQEGDILWDTGLLSHNTTYYWQIVAWDNHHVFTTGPIWSFTTVFTNPPYEPSNPNPYDGEAHVDTFGPDFSLSWTGGDPDDDPVKYDVYLGTSNPPPKVVSNQTETEYYPGSLDENTTYYWQIVAWDNRLAVTEGPIWSFTTIDLVEEVFVDDDYDENTPGWNFDHFNNINDAIAAVCPYGTILVYNGTYHEESTPEYGVIIDRPLNLIGEDKVTTIIDGGGCEVVVYFDGYYINDVSISGFTVKNSTAGILFFYNENTTISGNIITDTNYGIYLYNVTNSSILCNTVINNDYGIYIDSLSDNNNISENTIQDNNAFGIYVTFWSNDNTIYHNNLINNTQNAHDESNNMWYNAELEEGNYWEDYEGDDNNHDGIGDTPYDIPGGSNQDLYPLMSSYPLGDVNGDGKVNIDDIFLVLGAWGQTGEPGWIPEDVNNDGVVNIDDIFFVLAHWS